MKYVRTYSTRRKIINYMFGTFNRAQIDTQIDTYQFIKTEYVSSVFISLYIFLLDKFH